MIKTEDFSKTFHNVNGIQDYRDNREASSYTFVGGSMRNCSPLSVVYVIGLACSPEFEAAAAELNNWLPSYINGIN